MVLALLLAAPAYALSKLAPEINGWVLLGGALGVSALAFFEYRGDKRRAAEGEWRIPEATLLFTALIGGWPGAFLAQRLFRHKTAKLGFQARFWLVVLLHQLVAVDSLLGWRFTQEIARVMRA